MAATHRHTTSQSKKSCSTRTVYFGLLRLCIGALFFALLLQGRGIVQAKDASPDRIDLIIPDADKSVSSKGASSGMAEVRGLLPHYNDHHYFGLETTHTGGPFVVTLTVEPSEALADQDAVNFFVLTEEGLAQFLAGAEPESVKSAMGKPMLFDQVGNRLTALIPGGFDSGYTVIVFNHGGMAVAYTLQVQGGILRDDAGQTYAAQGVAAQSTRTVAATEDSQPATGWTTSIDWSAFGIPMLAQPMPFKQLTESALPLYGPMAQVKAEELIPEAVSKSIPFAVPVRARRVSGHLAAEQDRHYLSLVSDTTNGEIILRLNQLNATDQTQIAPVNFWIMTQDGVRQLVQGVQADELHLATGQVVEPGVVETRFRAAENVTYTVVIFNEGHSPTDYVLHVTGGIVTDQFGQTREAYAAAMEMQVLQK